MAFDFTDYINKHKIKGWIRQYANSEIREKLVNYYSYQTIWEVLKQSRHETAHTSFLAWFFDCHEFNTDINNGPAKKLLLLLLERVDHRLDLGEKLKDLCDSFYQSKLDIISVNAVSEYPINLKEGENDLPAYGEGNIDIFITMEVALNKHAVKLEDQKRRFVHIVIENKIDAPETTKYFDKDKKQLKAKSSIKDRKYTLYQTDAYYKFVNETFCQDNDINLFVYLNPISDEEFLSLNKPESHCKEYIQINYQKLLENVIEPISKRDEISEYHKVKLIEYIRTLSKPSETEINNNITIMALPEEERKLLVSFFNENEELIRAAIDAVGDDELKSAMKKLPGTPKDRTKYTISISGKNYAENIAKSHLALCLVKAYIEVNVKCTIDELKSIFSDIKDPFFSEEVENQKLFDKFELNGKSYYIPNNIWAAGKETFQALENKIDELRKYNIVVMPSN